MADGELLLEVRCEEIPARMLGLGIEQLGTRLFEELMAHRLTPSKVDTGYTPRRLVVSMRGLAVRQEDREEQLVGPPVSAGLDTEGNPTAAAIGFSRKAGVEPDELERVETPRGQYLAATRAIAGRPTPEILAELLPRVIKELSWPKVMRWGDGLGPWVRPVHGVVALFAGEVVPFELFGVASGRETCGHPWVARRPFEVRDTADYRRKLRRRKIEIAFDGRRRRLDREFRRQAEELGGELVEDPQLLDRLTGICAIPGVIQGRFSSSFLELAPEVLKVSLRDHQSAFMVERKGKPMACFLTVMDRTDDPAGRIRAGNEWVVEARLADAAFFWAEDRKLSLAEHADSLERLTFHARLGSYADKTARIEGLVGRICDELGWSRERPMAVSAARLLKADLGTEMVKEFTSLQGIMGGVYARADGLPSGVWKAVYDQYLPAGGDDPVPRGRVGAVCSLADRIDTLVGIFGLKLLPSGSKDPFGLRRAAQGAVRIALEADLPLDLDLVAARAVRLYEDRLELGGEEILAALRPFLYDRVRHLLGLAGYAYDEIEAALAAGGSNLPDLRARVDSLHRVRDEPGFLEAVLAAKRISKIVKDSPEYRMDGGLLREEAEEELAAAADHLRETTDKATAKNDYDRCLWAIAAFADPLERFFNEVLVMDEDNDLRQNRIALLQRIQRTMSRTAVLTELVVDRAEHRRQQEENGKA
jgi:glycyl-tRNA synthetase beta chain